MQLTPMQNRSGHPLPALVLVLLGSTLLAGCPEPRPSGPAAEDVRTASEPIQALRTFPCDAVTMTELDERMAPGTHEELSLADVLADEVLGNEVHDCQKLVRENGHGFGPLAAIYPLQAVKLEAVPEGGAHPFASVFVWGGESYAPLGLRPDLSCIWLQREDNRWAAVVAPAAHDTGCGVEQAGLPDGMRLQVKRLTRPQPTIYPTTARWDWDSESGSHYIGIKCGDGWCRIGRQGFTPRLTTLAGGGVRDIPGWYDAQHLAVPDGDTLVPGPWGVIKPHPALKDMTEFHGRTPIATVTLERDGSPPGHLEYYERTWNFRYPGTNQLRLLNRTDAGGANVDWLLDVRGSQSASDSAGFPVERLVGAMHAVNGAVRWRWDHADERSWIACDNACCTPTDSRVY